jgi:hypothetical protein
MSYKPSTESLPMVKVSSDPVFVSEYTGRWIFLESLQIEAPAFWSELRVLQQRGDPGEIVRWMTHTGVADQWFIDTLWETVRFWHDHPESPRARLEPGHRWFRYPLLEDGQVQIPPFAPMYKVPALGTESFLCFPDGSTGTLESPDEFASRIRAEFELQLQEYVRYLRSITGEDRTELRQHAQWTALAFTGLSYVRIADRFKHLSQSLAPDSVVKVAVRRFSERIGLTLPTRRRRRT